jgi:hypothetical protein
MGLLLSAQSASHHPEYVVPFLIHLLAHHHKYPSAASGFAEFVKPLSLFLEIVLSGAENYALIYTILETIKLRQDNAKVPYLMCFALQIQRQIQQ